MKLTSPTGRLGAMKPPTVQTLPKREPRDRGGRGNWKIPCPCVNMYHPFEAYPGCMIAYTETILGNEEAPLPTTHNRLARVIGRVDRSGTGERLIVRKTGKPGWWLHCIVLNDKADYCMQRYVDPTDVMFAGPPPTDLATFFFSANPLWRDPDTMIALQKHGSLSNEYVSAALNRIGNLQAADSPAFNLALNGVDEFRVSVAKAVKHGKLNPELLKESE